MKQGASLLQLVRWLSEVTVTRRIKSSNLASDFLEDYQIILE